MFILIINYSFINPPPPLAIYRWVCQYLPVSKQEQLEKLLASGQSVEVKSRDYDWKLNKL